MKVCQIPRTDLTVTRLAYGIGMLDVDWRKGDLIRRSVQSIRDAYEQGVTFFDTADVYAEGRSEQALGECLRDSPGLRAQIVVQTKCGLRLRPGWMPGEPVTADTFGADLRRDYIIQAVEGSLTRLGTDRLDILLLHSASPLVQVDEVAEAFDRLRSSGKALHFGVCSHNALQLQLLQKSLRMPLVVNQMWLSLPHHSPITDGGGFGAIVDYCRLHEIQVQAFSPLKSGTLFQKPLLLNPPADAAPEVQQLVRTLQMLARKYDATVAAIMLAWLLRHPAQIVPIIGASDSRHIAENCAADRLELDREEWELLLQLAARAPPG